MSDGDIPPVVGVIMMVAVTVVMISVVGTFIGDMAGTMGPPEASVEVSQEYDTMYDTYTVTVEASSMENANQVRVVAPDTVRELKSTGEFTRIDGLEAGDTISIVGVTSDEEAMIQTYSVEQ